MLQFKNHCCPRKKPPQPQEYIAPEKPQVKPVQEGVTHANDNAPASPVSCQKIQQQQSAKRYTLSPMKSNRRTILEIFELTACVLN
jgi:hypothetical protein